MKGDSLHLIYIKSRGRSCFSKYPHGTHQYNIVLITEGMSNLRWETALRQTRQQNKSHNTGSKRKTRSNCEAGDANKSRSNALTESGCKKEMFISSKQGWPATITPASLDRDRIFV